MKRAAHVRTRSLLPALAVGVALGSVELLLTAATHPELFLSIKEFARFGAIAVSVALSLNLILVSALAVVSQLLRRLAAERVALGVALVTGLAAAPLAVWLFWELSEGRRVHALSWRPLAVCAIALLSAAAMMAFALGMLGLSRAAPSKRRAPFALLLSVAAVWLTADAVLLLRLYPAFHVALDVLALLCGAAAVAVWPWRVPTSRGTRTLSALGIAVALGAPFLLRDALDAPNLAYAIDQAAPLSGKLLRLLRASHPKPALATPSLHAPSPTPLPAQPGIALRGESILLITIDALRADRLRSYGSHEDITPTLDRLAAQSVVFTRAYTQTPHTSYALGSLFTGKYLRPVLSLPGAPREHATLPRILRRYGYRTAGFYPPAVFFVDEERFASLSDDHFGFEYVKEMFAPGDQRVIQLQQYFAEVEAGHPLFVWVHLFEPHEPYDPAPGFGRGDEPEQRYNGEVAAADAAVGELIRVFRAQRPNGTVIVTADHGEEFGDHGGYHHGTTLFDEQVRVPLIWSSPGRAAARRVDAPVQLVDLAPTLLAALGLPKDARMRGADLSPILGGATPDPALRAFASIDELRMWTDGAHKLVCEASQGTCRLYDLLADPREARDTSAEQVQLSRRLSIELSDLVASIPGVEAISMQSGGGWPKVLARARLGDAAAGPELLPLLGDDRPAVRAEAARAAAALKLTAALPILSTLQSQDTDSTVRDEAALAAFGLGADELVERVRSMLIDARATQSENPDLARRAAFALLPVAADPAAEVLIDLAADSGASEVDRERALRALASARVTSSVPRLVPLLEDVRLRAAVARALGQLGGTTAKRALLEALKSERYPEARGAEAEALLALGDRSAKALILRLLGTETGVPGGLEHWADFSGPHHGPHGYLLDLREGRRTVALRGDWECRDPHAEGSSGCSPQAEAELAFSSAQLPKGETRGLLDVWANGSAEWLRVGEHSFVLRHGRNELAFAVLAQRGPRRWPVVASQGVRVQLLGIVPRTPDIQPPPPDPK